MSPRNKIDIDQAPDSAAIPQHECGLFGVFGHPKAAVLTYYGLFALQHRGQESAGIVTSNGLGTTFLMHKDMGLVSKSLARKNWRSSRAHARSDIRATPRQARARSRTRNRLWWTACAARWRSRIT